MEFEEEKFFKELYIIHRMFATRLFLNLRLLSTLVVCIPLVDCLVNKYGYYVYMRLLYLFFCFSRINVYSHRHFRIAKIFFKISLIRSVLPKSSEEAVAAPQANPILNAAKRS